MQLLLGLASYLAVLCALIGGTALLISRTAETTPAVMALAEPGDPAPRIQAWLDREAEAKVYAEKERVAALAEAARVKELYSRKLPSIAEQAAMVNEREGAPSAAAPERARNTERDRNTERNAERDAKARRDAARRLAQREAQTAFGQAAQPERPAYSAQSAYQSQRDRAGL